MLDEFAMHMFMRGNKRLLLLQLLISESTQLVPIYDTESSLSIKSLKNSIAKICCQVTYNAFLYYS